MPWQDFVPSVLAFACLIVQSLMSLLYIIHGMYCFRPETQEEKILKEEIDVLKSELERQSASSAGRESLQGSEDQTSLHNLLLLKERDLELLTRELDDKIRFGQKAIERPGSGAGRAASYPERPGSGAGRAASYPERPGSGAGRVASFSEQPPSRSGSFEESRSFEFMDRPRSRGTGDAWTRQGDDRRAFSGGRERGFLGNREYRYAL
ncbi:hypothetical protein RJ639_042517 [Escallonia herrerae]|uniref:Uncharacterized protein n=1 Tax=Escallonia herrerae TaxID=1293975 RepID=A0AA89B367_9ASTE|nr:hypothetical protein RJ639_042517 [Escallonia herrerae]